MNPRARVRSGLRIAVALAIALLTMVSPLCAPLCAATACASGNSTADSIPDGCHHASASTAHGYGVLAATQLCGLKELPVAALREGTSSMALHDCVMITDESLSSRQSPSFLFCSSAASNDKPPTTTVLRI
jgi:hypothetical protein